MEHTKNQVKFSDYLLTRRFNQKLYNRLKDKLQIIVDEYAKEINDLKVSISMSAKYQTPYIRIETEEEAIGHMVEVMKDAIDEVGYSYDDEEKKHGAYYIHFSDED